MHLGNSHLRSFVWACLTACSLLLFGASGSYAESRVQLLASTPLDVDGGATTATTTLQLYNPTSAEVSCRLAITDAIAKNTGKPAAWGVTFYGNDGKPAGLVLQAKIGARASLPVRVDLAHLVDAGETDAALKCNDDKISDLKLVKEHGLPIKVSLEGNPAEKPVVEFVDGSPVDLRLKNDDPMEYPLDVHVVVKGISVAGIPVAPEKDVIKAGPNGLTWFTVKPESGWFSGYQSFFKSEQVDGIVTVGYKPPGATGAYPSKTIPIAAKLDYFHPGSRAIWSALVILFFLGLGGWTSTYLKVNLVNRVKAISINKRLGQLARIIGEIGPQLNSELRVSLWLERDRIKATLPSGFLFTQESTSIVAQSDADTSTLKVRVDWATQISDACVRLEHSIDAREIAPTLADRVNRDQRTAQDLLKKSMPGADELSKIQSLVGDAANLLNGAGAPDDILEATFAPRLAALTARFTPAFLGDSVCLQIKAGVPIPFSMLDSAVAPLGSQFDRDLRIRQLLVIADMVQKKSTDAGIIACLQREDFVSLRMAEQLLTELKEGISPSALAAEITPNPPRVYFIVDRDTIRPNTPIMTKLMFKNSLYNRAAAKQRIECTWDFGHGPASGHLTEKGWEVHHYFPAAGSYNVNLTFKDMNQADIAPGANIVQKLTVVAQATDGQGHRWVEIQRWAVGFLVGIVGLFAGAKDKILSLDTIGAIIVLFLLGFTIDVAKNLLVSNDTSKAGS
jgi:hypothetical protein